MILRGLNQRVDFILFADITADAEAAEEGDVDPQEVMAAAFAFAAPGALPGRGTPSSARSGSGSASASGSAPRGASIAGSISSAFWPAALASTSSIASRPTRG